jgi:hypothetical protein
MGKLPSPYYEFLSLTILGFDPTRCRSYFRSSLRHGTQRPQLLTSSNVKSALKKVLLNVHFENIRVNVI